MFTGIVSILHIVLVELYVWQLILKACLGNHIKMKNSFTVKGKKFIAHLLPQIF
jgi:hypothetical protein